MDLAFAFALVNEKWYLAIVELDLVIINVHAKSDQTISYGSRVMPSFTYWSGAATQKPMKPELS